MTKSRDTSNLVNDTVDVTDFGAVGDGVVDDTLASDVSGQITIFLSLFY